MSRVAKLVFFCIGGPNWLVVMATCLRFPGEVVLLLKQLTPDSAGNADFRLSLDVIRVRVREPILR